MDSLIVKAQSNCPSANWLKFMDAISSENSTLDEDHNNDAVCAYFHTGGTTGMPKVFV